MRPVHPGEIRWEDYLIPLDISASALAKALNVPTPRINDIVRERRGFTADTPMRLARYFVGDAPGSTCKVPANSGRRKSKTPAALSEKSSQPKTLERRKRSAHWPGASSRWRGLPIHQASDDSMR